MLFSQTLHVILPEAKKKHLYQRQPSASKFMLWKSISGLPLYETIHEHEHERMQTN